MAVIYAAEDIMGWEKDETALRHEAKRAGCERSYESG